MTPEELKQRREHLGMSEFELAERLGVEPATYLQWERGDGWPEAAGMLELAMDHLQLLSESDIDSLMGQVEVRIDRLKDLRNELAKIQRSAQKK
jgi:transcriptional regulator with XRE-family HTH domain